MQAWKNDDSPASQPIFPSNKAGFPSIFYPKKKNFPPNKNFPARSLYKWAIFFFFFFTGPKYFVKFCFRISLVGYYFHFDWRLAVTKSMLMVMQHIGRGTLQKLHVSHFNTMMMVSFSHVFFVVLLVVFWNKSSKWLGFFFLLKVGISLIVHKVEKKFYVSKLLCAFVFWRAFDSAKFKILIFFCLKVFFFYCFMKFLVKIYMKRYERHNKTLWTTDFFNSVLYLFHPKIKFYISYWTKVVTDSNLARLLGGGTVKKKTHLGQSSNLSQALRHQFFFFFFFLA